MVSVAERIQRLKKEKNAVILAHNYTLPEVQDLADYVGDSLGLSMEASKTDADIIVFCGVSFMGETAKILSPNKTVLLPEPDAHCAMAAMCTGDQLRDFKECNPGFLIIGYVNSSAEAKKEMDICCTSSNAVKIVESVKWNDILFVPDKNLGAYASSVTGVNIRLWDGFCPIHQGITVSQVNSLKKKHPRALILAHPECRAEVLELADHVGSTEAILKMSKTLNEKEFIILTEVGMKYRLEKENPGKMFFFPESAVCTTMKMPSPESILRALEHGTGEVILSRDILEKARNPVQKMIDIK
ncbi:quinolinate synthase A [Candidatus Methanoplasma termitum]|uniref:Quinolinate synthase n=1 Tax=Candidatus Methanoplasma termitum TaxID=1577791 RepID=A0A0A7LGG2_9ARCH|nr:quinolinate synthase NadA [Candidatus Methanoplasma termitum]AIZ56576.1 quinolinate synthase A [Candidatus Methanoplasma termitum]MCL2333823.1 quinolinate synthase NadA [Candidatus Methanoplasma sp.]